jgi:hypothetical protein
MRIPRFHGGSACWKVDLTSPRSAGFAIGSGRSCRSKYRRAQACPRLLVNRQGWTTWVG